MARTGISKEQVFTAAAALAEEGIKPTVKDVRARIGSGSFSTVSGFLAQWRDEHASETVAAIPDMPEKVRGAFTQVWAVAARAAQDGVDTQKQALEAMQREIRQEQADMAAEIERLEQLTDEQARNLDLKAAERDELKKGWESRGEELNKLRIENTRLEEQRNAAQARGNEIKQQFEALQAEFTDAVKAAGKSAAKPASRGRKAKAPPLPGNEAS